MPLIFFKLLVILCFSVISPLNVCAEESWIAPEMDLGSYDEIFIFGIDLREFKIEEWDSEDEEYFAVEVSPEVLEAVANILYENLAKEFKRRIKVNAGKVVDKTKKSLVAAVKLVATFQTEESGMINDFIQQRLGTQMSSVDVQFIFDMIDAQTQAKVFSFDSIEEIVITKTVDLFSSQEDLDAFSLQVLSWARKTVAALP